MTVHITKTKGDLAVAKVIADLTEKGYVILTPLISEHLPFDLVAYKDQKMLRIQVKHSTDGIIKNKTQWSSRNKNHVKTYNMNDFDYYAVKNTNLDDIQVNLNHIHINFDPTLFYDLQKYHIEAWKQYESFKTKCVTEAVQKNMKRGIKEELYRSDIDTKILTHLRIVEMEFSMNLDYYHQHQFEFVKVHIELLKHFLFGIATLKGHKLINKLMNEAEKD